MTGVPLTSSVDVLIATDLRLPGGTVASLVEEVKALHGAGYSVGLVQVFSPLVARPRPLNEAVLDLLDREQAELVLPQAEVESKLAVLRHPSVFATVPAPAPTVRAAHVVLVANQACRDRDGQVHYDTDTVDAAVEEWTGHRPVWSPIGPLVRDSLLGAGVRLRDDDWVNVIDVDEWATDRSSFRDADRPVIGRHSRPQPAKWPDRRADLLAAYPVDGSVRVRVLGGAEAPGLVLGGIPAAWEVEEFGSRHPRDFLRDIDFFVYYHRADMVEAFGRTVMEAMASGAVAVLDPALRRSFGEAAQYAEPAAAMDVVRRLHADPDEYRRRSHAGQLWVRERFGHEQAVARVRDLIGPSGRERVPGPEAPLPTVLFVSSNGAGMGHLTRLLAMARRSTDWCRPVFLSLSQAVPVVGRDGFPYEYFPSRAALQIDTGAWNPMFEVRFRQALDDHRPAAVVFDGTWPYLGLIRAREDYPDVRFVWSRRAMWKADTPPDQLEKSRFFDLVIEPGEAAAEYDRGPTTRAGDAVRVAPITYLEPLDLLDREEARRDLGIRPDAMAVLVALGAGNINDISSTLGAVTDALAKHEEVEVVVTRSPIAQASTPLEARLKTVSTYPLSRYFNAFDGSVAAAGYNAFHESLAFALPSVFVPNTSTRTDDQVARARWAEDRGMGWRLDEMLEGDVDRVIAALMDDRRRGAVRDSLSTLPASDGAAAAARHVGEVVT